ncbi:hypothetical protein QRI27_003195 [Salmonella enterica]|uniref:Uncharacterized protein n=1 Tax=Salmonella enterica subsp. enterica serovar Panama TaxID=29472 RepID=A0A5U8J3X3_SALET|nr:hypothetical protein [Salmonella enterica]EBR7995506.1 hypothetical protein [Salmonella enterica subsp. enterica serovar Panama]ASD85732.1 hypothetical protein LFZ16_05430 [Salmonella enterica subsp. enterica serovar India str. SA20085604]EBR8432264.1 hypothetical protein [Salmonella enterica subsp. enterica serovar Panama]EBW9459095.1 hypothetical protein [Salmonella enterica subsp. enterica serovar Panama]EHW7940169.1 hypothetical protein [Salmonella enterica]
MALSNKERQKQYRNSRFNRGELGDSRINTFVTFEATNNLKRLSEYYNLSKRQVLELLINTANQKLIDNLEIDSPEWYKYFDCE